MSTILHMHKARLRRIAPAPLPPRPHQEPADGYPSWAWVAVSLIVSRLLVSGLGLLLRLLAAP